MTKEELRKEATFTIEWDSIPMIDRPLFVHAYITGALPREKRIAELEAQIEELEKENTELKKELKISQRCWQDQKNISLDANCSLHKAKEIIKNILHTLKNEDSDWTFALKNTHHVLLEAEQFLEEESE